jgi:hypothetical protein
MINKILIPFFFILSISLYAQVGINTDNPKSTLDINGVPEDPTKPDAILAPKLTFRQLHTKSRANNGESIYGEDQVATLVYLIDYDPDIINKHESLKYIIHSGYHYFDGTYWKSLRPITGSVALTASIGIGSGGVPSATMIGQQYNIIPLPDLKFEIGGQNWNKETNSSYKIPISGMYLINASFRILDYSITQDIFISVGNDNNLTDDDSYFLSNGAWGSVLGRRTTIGHSRIAYLKKDTEISLYAYSNIAGIISYTDAILSITILSGEISNQ